MNPILQLNPMVQLFIAILTEIIATTSLKYSEGFTRLGPSVVVVVGYGISFYMFSLSMKQIPLGVGYAIWSGVGIVGTAAIGYVYWQEVLTLPRIVGMGLIIVGVVVLNMFGTTH
jgi:small multidrug resistance pump